MTRRRRVRIALLFAALLALDAALPPRIEPTALLLRGMIRVYQWTVSPILARIPAAGCRFTPTCSHYGYESIRKYGTWKGGAKTVWRVLRCNPFGGTGEDLP